MKQSDARLKAKHLREICLKIALAAGDNAAHIGGALSCIDILSNIDCKYRYSESKEYMQNIVLSKGHACIALYSLLINGGIASEEEVLKTFEKNATKFLGHPCRNISLGILFSTGSLGNGVAHALGQALFFSKTGNTLRPVICILGDGECNEGIVWETLELVSKFKLGNLYIFVDCNGWQQTQRSTYAEDNYQSLFNRIKTFEIDTFLIDGHNHQEIENVLDYKSSKSKVVLAKTVKGKGFKKFENNNQWHHGVLTEAIYKEI